MNNQSIIEVLEHLDKHIIYDKHIGEICYSAEFIKVKRAVIKKAKSRTNEFI